MLKNIEICPESIDIFVFFGYNKYTNIPQKGICRHAAQNQADRKEASCADSFA